MTIYERLINAYGKEITRTVETTGTIADRIVKLDQEGWKIVKIVQTPS
jgi:hypothetical protein